MIGGELMHNDRQIVISEGNSRRAPKWNARTYYFGTLQDGHRKGNTVLGHKPRAFFNKKFFSGLEERGA
jgi:hypothetical protein